jgi:hypothetical protein
MVGLIALKLKAGTFNSSINYPYFSRVEIRPKGLPIIPRAAFQGLSVFNCPFLSVGTEGSRDASRFNTQVNTSSISFGGDLKAFMA